jgi:hypothetical protein
MADDPDIYNVDFEAARGSLILTNAANDFQGVLTLYVYRQISWPHQLDSA